MVERAERKAFGIALTTLNADVVRMAEKAQRAVRQGVESLVQRNPQEAREVYALDRTVFQLQQAIERECTDLIALQSPVARDLRTITTILKISTDIDRIARGARNIAELAIEIAELPPARPKKLDKISRSADLAIHMVDQAVRAFVEQNDQGVRDMGRFDDAVDDLYREILEDLIASMKDRSLDPAVAARLVLANRQIERIADHAVNIGERMVYLVSGTSSVRPAAASPADTPPAGGDPPSDQPTGASDVPGPPGG